MTGPNAPSTERLVVGCMTGTSIDSIDAALVRITGRGLEMRAEFLRGASAPLGGLTPRLRRLADQEPMTAGEIARLSRDFSLAHIPVIREATGANTSALVCIHGQTVFHQPPASWQMLTPAVVAQALRIPVVFDLRAADLAAGGQGAPITPIADWVFFRHMADPMAVVNLGGFSNYTLWMTDLSPVESPDRPWRKPADIRGGDICACNQLLDSLARDRLGRDYDEDGRTAARGVRDEDAYTELVQLLDGQRTAGRSLGTGDELASWTRRHGDLPAHTLLRSACEAIAETIARAIPAPCPILIAGGGARNAALRSALASRFARGVSPTGTVGLPIEYREAACFAVLGALCQDRVPNTLPQVTGVPSPAPISGAWIYP